VHENIHEKVSDFENVRKTESERAMEGVVGRGICPTAVADSWLVFAASTRER
jgi:hypothetical protein